MRVVSLMPSATEILALIEGLDLLVGRTHACDSSSARNPIPVVTTPATKASPESGVGEPGLPQPSEFDLDENLLAKLKPDLILTQSGGPGTLIDLEACHRVAASMTPQPRVLALTPDSLDSVFDDVLSVGQAVGRTGQARDAAVALRGRVHAATDCVNPYVDGPTVGFMAWTDPIMIAGDWTVQMIERAGGRHPLNETVPQPNSGAAAGPQQVQRIAGRSIAVSREVFAASHPEYLIVAPSGLSLRQAEDRVQSLLQQDWFLQLPAVRAGNVAAVDGTRSFSRPGPRLVDAFEWLAGWLNDRPGLIPDDFPWKTMGNALDSETV